jgi:hypothetical protein
LAVADVEPLVSGIVRGSSAVLSACARARSVERAHAAPDEIRPLLVPPLEPGQQRARCTDLVAASGAPPASKDKTDALRHETDPSTWRKAGLRAS